LFDTWRQGWSREDLLDDVFGFVIVGEQHERVAEDIVLLLRLGRRHFLSILLWGAAFARSA